MGLTVFTASGPVTGTGAQVRLNSGVHGSYLDPGQPAGGARGGHCGNAEPDRGVHRHPGRGRDGHEPDGDRALRPEPRRYNSGMAG